MLIKNIAVGLSANTTDFSLEMLHAASDLDRVARSATMAQSAVGRLDFSSIKSMPAGGQELPAPAKAPAPAQAEAPAAAAEGGSGSGAVIGAVQVGAMVSALAPLSKIGQQIAAQLNAVGGTITTLARRIDDAMKFPALQAGLRNLQSRIRDGMKSAAGVATDSLTRTEAAILRWGPAADKALGALRGILKVRDYFRSFGDVAGKSLQRLTGLKFDGQVAGVKRLGAGIGGLAPAANRATSAIKGIGLQLGLALGLVGVVYTGTTALKDFAVAGIKGASDLGETMSKTKEVFGDSTNLITAQADDMAKRYGLVKGPILDAASSIGLIAKGAGKSQAASAEMATSLTKLAADASSFYNVPLDSALEKIRSGLVGESEPLRAFGVLLSEEAVAAEAAALGLTKKKGKLDEASKVTARASLITKGLATASGDLARTQDSAANQFRRSSGGLTNFATSIGTMLLPAVQSGVGAFNELLATMVEVFEANRPMIQGWADHIKGAIDFVGRVVRNFPDYWQIFKIKAAEAFINVGEYVNTLPVNLGIVANWIADNWVEMIKTAVSFVGQLFHNLGTNLGNLWVAINGFFAGEGFNFEWTPLLDGFKNTVAELPKLLRPELTSMQREIDAVSKRIEDRERDRINALAKTQVPKPPVPAPLAKPADQEKYHGSAAVTLGSSEASSAVAKFRNKDNKSDATPKAQLEEAKKQTDLQKKQTDLLTTYLRANSGRPGALEVFKL
jgi:hypothetical protein